MKKYVAGAIVSEVDDTQDTYSIFVLVEHYPEYGPHAWLVRHLCTKNKYLRSDTFCSPIYTDLIVVKNFNRIC